MTELKKTLDALPPLEFPRSYNQADIQSILAILDNAHRKIRPYEGDFKAPWLLNDYPAPIWCTTNRGREEMINGKWENTVNLDWQVILPNGARLTDEKYARLLETNRKLAWLHRSGCLSSVPTSSSWIWTAATVRSLSQWFVLHDARYQPHEYVFSLLDQNGLNLLFEQLARGGWPEALQIPQRLLSIWHLGAFARTCPQPLLDNPYAIPREVCGTISAWLAGKNYYSIISTGVYRGRCCLNRQKMASQINVSVKGLSISRKLNIFFRQFEPEFHDSKLLLVTYQRTEYPSQDIRLIHEAAGELASERAVHAFGQHLRLLLTARHHLPSYIPDASLLSVKTATSRAASAAKPAGHTSFIPINTGIAYLNEAMRWVHLYGDAIVDYYLEVTTKVDFAQIKQLTKMQRHSHVKKAFSSVAAESFLVKYNGETHTLSSALGLQSFKRLKQRRDFDASRNTPTLVEALKVLIGACIVCIGILKPSREAELTHLKRNCLILKNDGYHINFELGKSNAGEAYQEKAKPIPLIMAKAIHLLQHLGQNLSVHFGDTRKIKDNLFYLPSDSLGVVKVADPCLLNEYLDVFCDYVALKPDALGRRWYVRIQEMRKWFLLLLFWAGRYDVLDAARWIAGHTDASHLYDYIEREFPGEELPRLEAQYSVDRLREFESTHIALDGESGLEALYERVRRHFNVTSLELIPEPEWAAYVTTLRAEEDFILEPHSIYAENGTDVVGINVSFRLTERTR